LGDLASLQAVTRVNAEQASKRVMRKPTRLFYGEGCYLLRTNLNGLDPGTLGKRYFQLTKAEWAFRITKDELSIRPLWHPKQDRVLAHILVLRAPALVALSLAYVLWKTLAQGMRGAGLGDAPRTLVEEIAKIKSGDVVLNARHADGREHPIRVRCVTTPDKPQKVLLHRLGLTLPQLESPPVFVGRVEPPMQ